MTLPLYRWTIFARQTLTARCRPCGANIHPVICFQILMKCVWGTYTQKGFFLMIKIIIFSGEREHIARFARFTCLMLKRQHCIHPHVLFTLEHWHLHWWTVLGNTRHKICTCYVQRFDLEAARMDALNGGYKSRCNHQQRAGGLLKFGSYRWS